MRKIAVALLFALGPPLFCQESQLLPSELYIPVSLKHTIKTEKARTGDQVHLRTEEAVLVGRGVVMPEGTELEGTVLVARKREGNSPSVLSFVVNAAHWKKEKLALHAFVAGIGVRRSATAKSYCDPFLSSLNSPSAPLGSGGRRGGGVRGSRANTTFNNNNNSSDCANEDHSIEDQRAKASRADMKDVLLLRSKRDSSIVMVSTKRDIRLHSGVLLMLRNVNNDSATEISQK